MKDQPQHISRRNFIRITSASGFALTLGAYLPVDGKTVIRVINEAQAKSTGVEFMSWISIDSEGKVTIRNHRSEMGQGTHQAIPQIIAEELEVSLDQVNVVFAAADPKKFGPQPQEGSFSVRGWYKQLLQVGATAREMLIEAAANEWNVTSNECYAENGVVFHRSSGKKASYGSLVEAAASIVPPKDVKLKNRTDYKVVGNPLLRRDIPSKTNGTAIFGLDKKLPGMLYAVVERCPRFLGKVKSIDDSATRSIPGVKHVFKVERPVFETVCEGVAVVADTLWAAMQGRKALKVEWDDTAFEHADSNAILQRMMEDIDALLKAPNKPTGFDVAFEQSTHKLDASYETPYESHSCMEPLNCIANVEADRIEIWGPIQEVNWIQQHLSERMGIPAANVIVNMTFLGGGFGRKAFPDYPHEAAMISKEIKAPVQVVWTREDDQRAGPFRPGAAYRCRGMLGADNNIGGFQTLMAAQAFWPGAASVFPTDNEFTGIMDGFAPTYLKSIPNYSFGFSPTKSSVPVMWWRSVYASTNAFANESFVDELAHAAGKDPLAFRRNHLREPRFQALIDRLESISNWKARLANSGWGVAITECFGTIAAHIVNVSIDGSKKLTINKVFAVMDCGWYVNPGIIRAQVEGSIVMAIGASVKHEIHFKDGRAVEQNFDTYKMPRMMDIPAIEVHIMENDEKPGGVGEPGLPPFAPALCNAIFDLTGKRIRKLPFDLDMIAG
ncbi:MAG: xanthine dehydrogenase family protein molybdopterin-binding subunit [Chryseolinea sp.]